MIQFTPSDSNTLIVERKIQGVKGVPDNTAIPIGKICSISSQPIFEMTEVHCCLSFQEVATLSNKMNELVYLNYVKVVNSGNKPK